MPRDVRALLALAIGAVPLVVLAAVALGAVLAAILLVFHLVIALVILTVALAIPLAALGGLVWVVGSRHGRTGA